MGDQGKLSCGGGAPALPGVLRARKGCGAGLILPVSPQGRAGLQKVEKNGAGTNLGWPEGLGGRGQGPHLALLWRQGFWWMLWTSRVLCVPVCKTMCN